LLVSLPYVFLQPAGRWTIGCEIYGDLAYLGGYLCLLLAIEAQPHRRQTGSLTDRERQLRTIGVVLLATFLLAYFVLVPATFNGQDYETSVTSFYLFISLDLVIVSRLFLSRRDAWSIRWSWVYTWLLVAATFTLAGDLSQLVSHLEGFVLPSATPMDLLWTTPLALVALAARAGHVTFPAEHRVLNEGLPARRTLRAGHLLLIGAMILPVAHAVLQLTQALDPATDRPREVVAALSLLVVGGLAPVA